MRVTRVTRVKKRVTRVTRVKMKVTRVTRVKKRIKKEPRGGTVALLTKNRE